MTTGHAEAFGHYLPSEAKLARPRRSTATAEQASISCASAVAKKVPCSDSLTLTTSWVPKR